MLDFTEKILKNFLNLYWLRPETAIWRTLDVLQIKNRPFQSPILDAGCGDGSFTFTHFLGQTSSSFDVYTTIKNTQKYFHGNDIHNQTTSIRPKIIKNATKKILQNRAPNQVGGHMTGAPKRQRCHQEIAGLRTKSCKGDGAERIGGGGCLGRRGPSGRRLRPRRARTRR